MRYKVITNIETLTRVPFCFTTLRCSLNQRQFAQIMKEKIKEILKMGEYGHYVVWYNKKFTKNFSFWSSGRKSTYITAMSVISLAVLKV